jgi:hypothetical protein
MRNRWLKRFLVLMAGVLALPYLLTLVYAVVPPPVSATMLWKKLEGQQIDYRWRPLSDTSQNLVRSVVTAEDAGICRHNGVEWAVLGEVITEAMEREGGPTRGGSTITQQVAKNLFLWPSRSYVRKGLEIPLALWIDLVWTKTAHCRGVREHCRVGTRRLWRRSSGTTPFQEVSKGVDAVTGGQPGGVTAQSGGSQCWAPRPQNKSHGAHHSPPCQLHRALSGLPEARLRAGWTGIRQVRLVKASR